MKAWLASANAHADELGRAGVAGIGLLVFSLGFALAALLPAHGEWQALQERYARIENRAGATVAAPVRRAADLDAALAKFTSFFPAADDARQDMLKLQGYAANHGIVLRTGEYRVAAEAASGLIRHQVVLPVKGPYLKVRAFVTEALEELPSLALESASFKRDAIGAREIDARLSFTLFTTGS